VLPGELILEGLVTTRNADGSTAIAPMGPIVTPAMRRLVFRPYKTSTTYANLRRDGQGIFHVTDNALMIAQAAIGKLEPRPELISSDVIEGQILADCCRWYAFRVLECDDRQPRTIMTAEVVGSGRRRDFLGFNRAKHAVVEAAILATRVHLLPESEIRAELDRLVVLIEKTGGGAEQQAWELLRSHFEAAWAGFDERRSES
jgi:hypothetical protein